MLIGSPFPLLLPPLLSPYQIPKQLHTPSQQSIRAPPPPLIRPAPDAYLTTLFPDPYITGPYRPRGVRGVHPPSHAADVTKLRHWQGESEICSEEEGHCESKKGGGGYG